MARYVPYIRQPPVNCATEYKDVCKLINSLIRKVSVLESGIIEFKRPSVGNNCYVMTQKYFIIILSSIATSTIAVFAVCWHSLEEIHYLKSFFPKQLTVETDPGIEIIGYQADFRELTEGLFLFNHACGSTVAIKAQLFIDLNDKPIFRDRLIGGDECMGYCYIRNNLLPCPSKCECAYVREVLQSVNNWSKVKV